MATISTIANIGNYHGLKYSNDGKPRISFSAAETARVKDQGGNWVDGGTTWYNVTLFGGASEALDALIAGQGGKGRVSFHGRMSTRVYEHNGEKRESLDVVAEHIGLVPKNQPANNSATYGGNTQNQTANHGGWGGNSNNVPDPGFGAQSEVPF